MFTRLRPEQKVWWYRSRQEHGKAGSIVPDRSVAAGSRVRPLPAQDRRRADDEWDILTSALNDYGVIHVAPHRRRSSSKPRSVTELFERLLTTPEPRLQQAAVVLLLTQPVLADSALAAIQRLDGVARDRAMRRYVAAASLQRMARTRIALQLGPQSLLPEQFVEDFRLPPLSGEYGRAALFELARQEEALYGYDAWGTYLSLLDLFLAESRRAGRGRVTARPSAR
jgi:hypothetical protein